MRSRLAAGALLALALAAPAARAEPVLGLRLGVAPAVGSAAADVPVTDTIPLQFPLQLDLLWRLPAPAGLRRVDLGLYGSWGPARAGRCSGGATCSASVERLGVQAVWTFPGGASQPWLGVASGYEWARESRTRGGTVTTTYRGFEALAAQGGIEWRLGRRFALGPFALLSVGRYARVSLDTGYGAASAEIPNKAVHAWLHLGVRGRVVLGGEP